MSVDQQTHLVGEPAGDSVAIETSGHIIKPLLALPTAIVDECKLHIDGDGLHVNVVDPSNVAMLHLDVAPAAFDAFDAPDEELVVGMDVGTFADRVSDARIGKRTDDDVAIDIDESRTRVVVDREYGGTRVSRTDDWLNLDAGSVRDEPGDVDAEPTTSTEAVDARAVEAMVDGIGRVDDCIELTGDPDADGGAGAIHAREVGSDGADAARVTLPDALADGSERATAKFSIDFLDSVSGALKAAKVDGVRLEWADEYPLRMRFERTAGGGDEGDGDGERLYGGAFILAPRIGGGGSD